jgi:hypothetical protein
LKNIPKENKKPTGIRFYLYSSGINTQSKTYPFVAAAKVYYFQKFVSPALFIPIKMTNGSATNQFNKGVISLYQPSKRYDTISEINFYF